MQYVGVDWGSNGWVCVERDEGGDWDAALLPSFLDVWAEYNDAETILVDIPIGLAQDGRRACDERAAGVLASHRTRVFPTPPRVALTAGTYGEAKALTSERSDIGLTTQAWSILPRIREVDTVLDTVQPDTGRIRESHPEIAFWGLNGREVVTTSKADEGGQAQRLDILDTYCDAQSVYSDLEAKYIDDHEPWERRFSTTNRDDLVDAFALAVTAWQAGKSFWTLPDEPPVDPKREVPIEIVFYDG